MLPIFSAPCGKVPRMFLRSACVFAVLAWTQVRSQTYTLSTAVKISLANAVAVDHAGNIYFDSRTSGDGGPASAATFLGPLRLAVDVQDNLYAFDKDRIGRSPPMV